MFTLIAGLASSILGGIGKRKQAEAQNKALKAQFEMNKSITQEALSTLSYRTDVAETEVVRDRVNRNIATKKAVRKATGSAKVSAAQLGIAGRRPDLALKEASKEGANLISDSNINAQIQLQNLTNQLNDTAATMVANLNNARPVYAEVPGTGALIVNAGISLVNSYDGMSDESKSELSADVSSLFKKDSIPDWGVTNHFGNNTGSAGAQIGIGA